MIQANVLRLFTRITNIIYVKYNVFIRFLPRIYRYEYNLLFKIKLKVLTVLKELNAPTENLERLSMQCSGPDVAGKQDGALL